VILNKKEVKRLGYVDIGDQLQQKHIIVPAKADINVTADVTVEHISFPYAFQLLFMIATTGKLKILALGTAQVHTPLVLNKQSKILVQGSFFVQQQQLHNRIAYGHHPSM